MLPAIHYPDESCIYIVNGEPVITFWGFLNAGSKLTGSPFDGLKPVGNFASHKKLWEQLLQQPTSQELPLQLLQLQLPLLQLQEVTSGAGC